jgi:hypothetical protein
MANQMLPAKRVLVEDVVPVVVMQDNDVTEPVLQVLHVPVHSKPNKLFGVSARLLHPRLSNDAVGA